MMTEVFNLFFSFLTQLKRIDNILSNISKTKTVYFNNVESVVMMGKIG